LDGGRLAKAIAGRHIVSAMMMPGSRMPDASGSPSRSRSVRAQVFGWELAVLTAVVLVCKVHRLTAREAFAESGLSVAVVWFHSMAADLIFLFVYALVWWGLLAIPRLARWVAIPFRLTTFALTALALAEQAFLRATGAVLDWHILRYGIAHFSELRPILLSFGWRKLLLGAGFLVGVALLPAAMRSLPLRRRGLSIGASFRRLVCNSHWLRSLSLLAFGLAAQSCLLMTNAPPHSSGLLVQNLYVRLGKTALDEFRRGRGEGPRQAAILEEQLHETRADRHHNIVLVVLESARAKSFSPYANGVAVTPFFDELAKRGALVENAYTVAPHTTKALVSIQCGIYPRLDPEPYEAVEKGIPVRCLPDLLRDAGYRSAFFQPAEENFERRKDLVREFGYGAFTGKQSLRAPGFDESNYLGFEDRALIEPVMEWVDREASPFLLTVLTLASHHPYSIPAGFSGDSFVEDRSENDYLNTLAYTDRFVRELYREFEARGLVENTIFVVLGDHGEAFGEHGVRQHDAVPYEEGLHVPMLLVGPPFKPGHPITGLRQHIDVLPTILEATGFRLEQPSRPGRSMLSTGGHERLYFSCHYRDYCLAGRNAREKVIHHYAERGPELFDLLVDPEERINLAGRRSLVVSAWVDDLRRWKANVGAQFTEGRQWHIARDVARSHPLVSRPLEVEFGADIRLLGYEIERDALPIGEQLTISHHFYVARAPDPSLMFVFHLMGPRSEDLTHPIVGGSYPQSQWKAGDYVTDRFTYFARPGTPQGEYRLMVGLWQNRRSSTGSAPAVAVDDETVVDGSSRVQTATFSVVAAPFERAEYVYSTVPPDWEPTESMLTPEIGLLGCKLSKTQLKRGVKSTLSCLYHAVRDNPAGRLCVTLQGPTTRTITHTPVRGAYPTDEWKANQYIVDDLDLYLTLADKDGDYRIMVGVEVEGSAVPASGPCASRFPAIEAGYLALGE
jgi:lipoteichoic acid synthase